MEVGKKLAVPTVSFTNQKRLFSRNKKSSKCHQNPFGGEENRKYIHNVFQF